MALSYTAFPVMMFEIYVRSFCRSRIINPYAGCNIGLWHERDIPIVIAAKLLTRDVARRITVNMAKLPDLL